MQRALPLGVAALLLCAWPAARGEAAPPGHVVQPAGLTFQTFPNLPTCFTNAVLDGDPATGPSVILAKSTGACRVPWHWHTPIERLMIVSGTAKLAIKGQATETLGPGTFARLPSKHVHEFSCDGQCMFFVTSDGPFDIHYVDEKGMEVPFEQAMKTPPASR